jgi:hypothetical protein
VFNEDFRQFVIRIGDKAKDGETISGVMIEDHTNNGKTKMNQILADSGQMYTTRDKRYFVMNLFSGTQYQEPSAQQNVRQNQKFPFVRTRFGSWTKVWDMKEFELVRSAEDKYSKQRGSLTMNELRANMDPEPSAKGGASKPGKKGSPATSGECSPNGDKTKYRAGNSEAGNNRAAEWICQFCRNFSGAIQV